MSGAEGRGWWSTGYPWLDVTVVAAALLLLVGLVAPAWTLRARLEEAKTSCRNNLRSIAAAAAMYADSPGLGAGSYPWPLPPTASVDRELRDGGEARAALELLYKFGLIDDARVFVCPASIDDVAEEYDTEHERRASFRLDENQCSYTWPRRRMFAGRMAAESPISGDARRPEDRRSNHRDGFHIAFRGGQVVWFDRDALSGDDPRVRRAREDLIGYERR